jgi:hypothetical protein
MTAHDGTLVCLVYDQEADMLAIFFGANEPATGIELTDHIVLRLNQQTKRAMSLLLLDFAILTERTEYGPRSYPLTTLHDFPEDVPALVLQIVTSMPVGQFLKVSHFQASSTESVPLTYVESQPSVPAA